jgi:hypothetical protein
MDPMQLVSYVCFYGPTPIAGVLAGWQAMQCKSPWHAFFVGSIGTVAMAVIFAIAADYLPIWGYGLPLGSVWQMHLIFSPLLGIPLGCYCAYQVKQRLSPPDQVA